MNIQTWRIDDVLGRDAYDALLDRLGGDALAEQLDLQRHTCLRLQARLTTEHQPLFLDYTDAAADHAARREEVVVRATLCLGVGIGAALARFPDQPPDALAQTAAAAVGGMLAADLPPSVADEVARAALGALARVRPRG